MDQFLRDYPAGSKIDTDGFPAGQPYQCFDPVIVYMRIITGIPNLYISCRSSGFVKDWWNDFDSNGLSQWFERVPWNSTGQRGDILIWGNAPATPYSHTAILLEDRGPQQYVYGQNQPHPYTTIINFTSDGLLGYIRPKVNTGGNTSVETLKSMYWRLLGREADADGLTHYTKQVQQNGWEFVYNDLKNSDPGQKDWQWRNPDAVRSLEARLADAQKSQSVASQELSQVREQLSHTGTELLTVKEQKAVLEAAIVSQNRTIEELKAKLEAQPTPEPDNGGINPTPPVSYAWMDQLRDWLRSIFHK